MSYGDGGTTFPPMDGAGDGGYNRGGGNNQQHGYQNNQGNQGNNGNYNRGGNQGGGGGYNRGGNNQGGGGYNRGGGNGGGGWQGQKSGGWQGRSQRKNDEPEDLTLYKPYGVAGNENPPAQVIAAIERLVKLLEQRGYTMRSGGVRGVEDIAEKSIPPNGKMEIHLPWRDFEQKASRYTFNSDHAKAIARMFHPAFDTMKPAGQAFLCKNARVILGNNMKSPVLFLLVWTEDGAETLVERVARTGYAGHSISIAAHLGVPVFNLGKPDAEQRLMSYLDSCQLRGE